MSRAVAVARSYGLASPTLAGWWLLWTAVALLSFGLTSALIPNPVFGRGVPAEPFAFAVWLASAPLIGLAMATYFAPPPEIPARPLAAAPRSDGRTTGTLGGLVAFLAIGCPTCNKIALLLLGSGGAATVFGPIQPFLGAISLALLAGTVAWRLRLRAVGYACAGPR
jgi:hypothetical protein